MGKKIKLEKLGSTRSQESSTNEPPNKEDEAQPNVTLGPSTKTRCPSNDKAPNSNQQQQPSIVQWPYSYTPQNAAEQLFALLNQGQQIPHPQQGQVFAQSPLPFWLPQPPAAAGPLLGPYLPPIFQAFNGTGWQGHPVVPEGTSSTTQTLVPNVCYQFGYIFPGFPGVWYPSSCLAHMHQLHHPYVYNLPWMPAGCLASGEHSFQGGIIKPPAKLSKKQLREADQPVENVQQWSLINKLQAEVSDYKDRLTKLEEEVLSLKVEELSNEVIETTAVATGQPSKRGRSSTSMDALHESQPRARRIKSEI